jgi:hypothetical protein
MTMRHRLASPVGLATAVAVFFGVFVLSGSLVVAVPLAAAAALGVYLMVDDRTPREVADDEYVDDANHKVADALRVIDEIRGYAPGVASAEARASLTAACRYVPELFERIRITAPNSLYSTASQVGGHLDSLRGVLTRYLDIQRRPELYSDPAGLQRGGEAAFARFAEFALDSVRLVNQGDLARYQANLDTVAPPKLPELG